MTLKNQKVKPQAMENSSLGIEESSVENEITLGKKENIIGTTKQTIRKRCSHAQQPCLSILVFSIVSSLEDLRQ